MVAQTLVLDNLWKMLQILLCKRFQKHTKRIAPALRIHYNPHNLRNWELLGMKNFGNTMKGTVNYSEDRSLFQPSIAEWIDKNHNQAHLYNVDISPSLPSNRPSLLLNSFHM